MTARRVVVMLKEPRPGRVKTRLGREIGHVAAARWFRRQTTSLLRRIRDPRWQVVLAVSPDREGMASRIWPEDLARLPQGHGDLGDRMGRVFRSSPPGQVLIIGADVPGITRRHLRAAFTALGTSPSVIGPAEDGGFWLVGLRHGARAPAALFRGVRWSTTEARADTLATLPQPVAEVDRLRDVDTAADASYFRRRRIS